MWPQHLHDCRIGLADHLVRRRDQLAHPDV